MQSLLSQITGIFVGQSINTLENNGLQDTVISNQDFGSVFDTLSNSHYPAKLAAFDDQKLPPSYTSISFQISHFSVTAAQQAIGDEAIESLSEFKQPNFFDGYSSDINLNTFSNNSADNVVNIIIADDNAILPNSIPDQSLNDKIPNSLNVNTFIDKEVIGDKFIVKNETLTNHDLNKLIDGHLKSRTVIENGQISQNPSFSNSIKYSDIDAQKAIYAPNNSAQSTTLNNTIENVKADDGKVAHSPNIANQSGHENQSFTNQGVISANKPTSHSLDNAVDDDFALIARNHRDVFAQQIFDESAEVLPVKSESINKVNNSRHDLDFVVNPQSGNRNINDPVSNFQHANINELSKVKTPAYQSEIDRSTFKPTNNVNYQNDIRDSEINYRSENRPHINIDEFENLSFNDRNTFVNNPKQVDTQIELVTQVKTHELGQDIKTITNNNIVDRHVSPSSPVEPLTHVNKPLTLDRATLQTVQNEVSNSDEVVHNITWAKNNNATHVKIALAPEHLGALEINIDQDADGLLNIQFTTQNALAKDAIETFMPRLKDMLEQQGLNLQNANVSQQGSGNHSDTYSQTSELSTIEASTEEVSNAKELQSSNTNHAANNHLLEVFA